MEKKKKKEKEVKKEILLSIKNASYQYSDAEKDEYALKNVSYDFEKGKIYAIRGRSGTGKTTLLSLISGLERCTEGEIVFDGKDLKDINLDYYRSHEIGIVFQSYNLLPFMTASENMILSMDASGMKIPNKKDEAIKFKRRASFLPLNLNFLKYNDERTKNFRASKTPIKKMSTKNFIQKSPKNPLQKINNNISNKSGRNNKINEIQNNYLKI